MRSASGRDVRQPDHVVVNAVGGGEAERGAGGGEEGLAAAEHGRPLIVSGGLRQLALLPPGQIRLIWTFEVAKFEEAADALEFAVGH